MSKRQYILTNIVFLLIGLALVFELIRDSQRIGDFNGYLIAGNNALAHKDIYSNDGNTWPPFFTVFAIPLALGANINIVAMRLVWLIGSIVAAYYTLKLIPKLVLNKEVSFKNSKAILFQDPVVFVPLIFMLRFILDNISNLQINIYMLWLSCLTFFYFTRKKYALSGLLLALTISMKVYTIFILFYFIFKREFKPALWALAFILLFNLSCFLVFGVDTSMSYYHHWYHDILSAAASPDYKNQSVFGLMFRLCTSISLGTIFQINLFDMNPATVKTITYFIVIIAALYPAIKFRNSLKERSSLTAMLEYSFVSNAIPLLSPLAWKAYFIFLWPAYFIIYLLLFRTKSQLSNSISRTLKVLFTISVLLTIFTTDGIIGMHLAEVAQTFSLITIGAILPMIILVILYNNADKFSTDSIKYSSYPTRT
jgi:hypothetical protein